MAFVVLVGGAAVSFFLLRVPTPGAVTAAAPLSIVPAPSGSPSPVIGPATPVVAEPGPRFDVVRVSPQGNAVIAGRGAPGADIVVFDGATEVARTRADARGEFVALPALPLMPGGRELTLASRAGSGPQVKGDEAVVLMVPEAARPALVGTPIGRAAPDATPPVVAMLLPQQGAPRVLQELFTQRPAGSGSGSTEEGVTLDTVDYDDAGAIQFKGGAAGGSTIRIYVDTRLVGAGQADATGRWSVTPGAGVPGAGIAAGEHVVRADRIGADGTVVARVEMPFQRAEVAPADVAGGRVVVQPGQNLWRLARAAYGHGVQYTVIYLANKDQIRDARRIYPGQAFSVPSR